MKNVQEIANQHAPSGKHLSVEERQAAGKALRKQVPHDAHGEWKPADDRADPVALLEISNRGRIPDLVPVRHHRMLESPFTFYRGSALAMAADLAQTPVTGIQVQACGDAHLMNFGGFASPERTLIFDLNDFDETLPGPWEWDLKRLVTSIYIAGEDLELKEDAIDDAVRATAESYRQAIRDYGGMRALDVWYSQIQADTLLEYAPDKTTEKAWKRMTSRAEDRTGADAFLKQTEEVNGKRRLIDQPPQLNHPPEAEAYFAKIKNIYEKYVTTLRDEYQFLLQRYRLVDASLKVVGVGSVGTHCGVALLMADDDDPLMLQFKEARPSVLEPYVEHPPITHQGRRVVHGQRLMQAASDIFLGWTSDEAGQDYYFRQLWDKKTSINLKGFSAKGLMAYGNICSRALARAHACSGNPAMIGGYLGSDNGFDKALTKFARAYAKQNKSDYTAMMAAVKEGRIEVKPG
ncbi:MAG: DUF2252 domain-containing protein [Verrucomicrobia bacterium]|nr:DUF2252 domain-containing protein [Verrucomicrobiota bacterium]MCH8510052.1 DUF2252 domain-containing protein [Kiritimatiellia bacterium]